MGLDERLSYLRKQKGVTIEQLSDRSGVPLSTVKKICAGITANPNLETVKMLAKALNCRLDDLDDESAQNQESLSRDEQQLIDGYRELSAQGKEYIRQTMSMAKNTYKKRISSTDMEAGT
ncbi:helix-turn-helix domain-containing protein [Ethanoligenens harbinense]|uniref:Helix-turn-helix domain protein n=1 Tax=Ethanoligenens harbinense (strain DSM 18485 / JCM 12961 / CGMCC 1.5033 / YUAN-3) TaxID=663278 RepID=E6U4C1_ETHHY|nr:helix-turn-helix transcriptional regulator [Ethanoligenens harbinense]ADU27728.1 helix-turn-helix domain protein [Ethanoligenens harbinense YUAN-3]AVQ96758.1 XRE family transcriptional regulator [Ethanoligenens harbinense YUAN-3]AYF39420.1 XRE family transcriptional regulator [Ethanoligenens harbinense]AYF42244.1 XRE family transcriptional regulator [Ethanoligenens harbinense]QCN93000.1 XRE family transcriptional regulator [Ethanoligenens harbinense]